MSETSRRLQGGPTALRWTARAVGLIVAGLFVWFLLERGRHLIPTLDWLDPRGLPLLLVLLGAVIGAVLAWRWEFAGGLLAIAGGMGILALVLAGSGRGILLGSFFFILPLLLAGTLYLGCSIAGRWRRP